MSSSAIVLVAHGSPQPQWAKPAQRVRDMLRQRRPDTRVELAFLPPAPPDVFAVIDGLVADGVLQIEVVAMLLSGGGRHMTKDIPEALAQLRTRHEGVEIRLCAEALGGTDEVLEAMAAAAARLLG